jgi:hypothetical protein
LTPSLQGYFGSTRPQPTETTTSTSTSAYLSSLPPTFFLYIPSCPCLPFPVSSAVCFERLSRCRLWRPRGMLTIPSSLLRELHSPQNLRSLHFYSLYYADKTRLQVRGRTCDQYSKSYEYRGNGSEAQACQELHCLHMGPQVLWGLLGRHESVGPLFHSLPILRKRCQLAVVLHLSESPDRVPDSSWRLGARG